VVSDTRRVAIANHVVELSAGVFGDGVSVHWDDCDMDEARFWVHVRLHGLLTKGPNYSKRVSSKLQTWRCQIDKMLDTTLYQASLTLLESPEYRRLSGGSRGYTTDTWVLVLAINGGPDAIFYKTQK